MEDTSYRAIAIVGLGAVLPDAPNVAQFWQNVKQGRYSISEVSPERWDPDRYYDPDPKAPDKTYSKIGGWVREHVWEPVQWHLAIPPRVVDAMDQAQKWAIGCTRAVLEDYGYPRRPLHFDRTAVILGNAMAGEKHYMTALRVYFPEYAHELQESPSFAALPESIRRDIIRELHGGIGRHLPEITEDSMPGELSNCIAGRIANTFNFHGPNYVADAACASAMAAMSAAVEGLIENDYDAVITGGIDRNMGASTFVKFCKIGALSATGTRPYADGADGFVMGEGAALFLLKRLADAERDGDKIYAVLRGIGGSSDGKGKGITAPNPVGQKLCVERAWCNAGVSPATVTMIEGHGTSTRVGDVVEVQSAGEILSGFHLPSHSVALGSVKSNIGHLKGAAGAAGILKATLSLHEKVLPPSLHCDHPNPGIDFGRFPLYVNTELTPWTKTVEGVRRAGVSAFGFGGTNFHAVLEEYIPHKLTGNGKKRSVAVAPHEPAQRGSASSEAAKTPLRGALLLGANSESKLAERLRAVQKSAAARQAPAPAAPHEADLRAMERIAIDYVDAADLADKCGKALKAFAANEPAMWKALRAQGIFRGQGPAPKVAFLYTGQGSQYVNMLQALRAAEPIVAETFAEADGILAGPLGKKLSDCIFVDGNNLTAVSEAEEDLRQTAITQPAVLSADIALTRLLAAYAIRPDLTMGHSLGEYAALVVAGGLPFEDALEAVCARGREMTRVSLADNGTMAAVFAPVAEVERILQTVSGYVVIANINSDSQAVIGGATKAVEEASARLLNAGYNVVPLPVSHAFHTSIVAPASEPLRRTLERLHLQPPTLPIVANVNGEFYPMGPDVRPAMLDILARQIYSPVQFVQGLRTLHAAGARMFVEVGPKKALQGFVDDVLGAHADVVSLFTNHPKVGDIASFNQALCGLYAAGLGAGISEQEPVHEEKPLPVQVVSTPQATPSPVVVTGASLGLPGPGHIFDDSNVARILKGEEFIDAIPLRIRKAMLDKHVTRLVKTGEGGPSFESIDNVADVIKLAGRGGEFDLETEFGVSAERLAALDRVTRLAIAAGLDALRDAGIPLVMRQKTTSIGTQLRDRWGLPDELRDDTGVIFASVFPGYDSFADEMSRYYADRARHEQLSMLESLRARLTASNGHSPAAQDALQEIEWRMEELQNTAAKEPYVLDRRFLFRVLSMGHSQFAELIGARGPNTQVNAACASTTQAVSLANDWIRAGRCRRVIIVSADDIASDHLLEWFGAGFLASGAAATDDVLEEAALPFDRRRHGMIIGMGAAAMVLESADAARERGLRPICEVLSSITANSAFHGTRLDVHHISDLMERLIAEAESRHHIHRDQVAAHTVFVSHETYTPARGGSASAEIHALRHVFGANADQIVIANTKGFTGHAMGTGIEDVVAVKALETGVVPPVANFREVDPELGALNLSKGGMYPVEYALRLGAGFGSQISLTFMRFSPPKDGKRHSPNALGFAYRIEDQSAWSDWLKRVSGAAASELETVQHTLRVRDHSVASPQTALEPKVVAAQPKPVVPAAKPVAPEPKPAVAAVKPAAPKPVVPQPKPVLESDPVKERILALVAEKTGYPVDMLGLDLDLEADLGVDTVKQAEMFAAVRAEFDIPRDENMKLRDFPTLAHVIRFARDRGTKAVPPVQTVAASAPAPPPEPVMAAAASSDSTQDKVLKIVSEKTGYPLEMLDLDLDLEADLGIDTVKQAEMFASVRAAFGIARDENLKLRDFPTLKHVIQFAKDRQPEKAEPPHPSAPPQAAPERDLIQQKVLLIVSEKTGYPVEMLDLDLDLEADLGIDTVKQAEMFASVRTAFGIPRDENLKLRDFPTLKHVIQFAKDRQPEKAEKPEVSTPKPQSAEPQSAEPQSAEPDPIRQKVLQIVAEKTGYPMEMLDLDLDLEADLGIDTVKQAEMFASVRTAFGIPRDESLKLRDFPTLKHVIQFAVDRKPQEAGTLEPVSETANTVASLASFAAADAVPRRVPVPVLRPQLAQCKLTAVTLGASTRVVVMPDQGGVASALAERLNALGVEVLRLVPASTAETVTQQLEQWLLAGPITGVYWLPALDVETSWSEMDAAGWHEALRLRVKLFHTAMRFLYGQIAAPGTFLLSATRLGGQHGYDPAGVVAPLGGAATGFTKAYKQERRDALVKAVDFESFRDPLEIADILVQEAQRDPGAVEIGYKNNLRWTVGLEERPAVDGQPGMTLNKDTVFVVTGAAGSIVSAITADLAQASGGTFYLLDLTPEPPANDPDIARFASDREGLKKDLFARMQARGERATPALVEREISALERAHAARSAIDAVHAAGGKAHYFSVDLTNGAAVEEVIRQVRERSGRIDVLLHAAGMDRSRLLPDKDAREFDLVFDVKADGWFHLMRAIGDMPLGAVVAFSSVAGRFGNRGQADYSAANDLLCKLVSNLRSCRPATRAIAIDWTAWGGVGMASRGSIPKMMEQAGIDVLPLEAGVPVIRRELTEGGTRGEVVIAKRLGVLLSEWDASGGVDPAALSPKGPMTGEIVNVGLYHGLTVEAVLDPKTQPFLYDHQIDNTPVLPGVMGIEAFAEAALLLLPGWHIAVIEDVNFLAPFKFYRNEPRKVVTQVQFYPDGEAVVAECRLMGTRLLPNRPEPEVTTHFTGRVRLTREAPQNTVGEKPPAATGSFIPSSSVYRVFFHGPAYQVVEQAWREGDRIIGRMSTGLPAECDPASGRTCIAPRLIELCFQTAGLEQIGVQNKMGLPRRVRNVQVWPTPDALQTPRFAIVAPNRDATSFDVEVVDSEGLRYATITGYETIALPETVDAEPLAALHAVIA